MTLKYEDISNWQFQQIWQQFHESLFTANQATL